MTSRQVQVGVGVFVIKDGKFLMMLRTGKHGTNTWAVPGGHLEFGESFAEAAKREVKEETALTIDNVRFAAVTNDFYAQDNKHSVAVWLLSDWVRGNEKIMEPQKCGGLCWFTLDSLPAPLFSAWKQLLASEFIDTIRAQLV